MQVVNINDKLSQINEYWHPAIAGELNGQHVKLVKFKGAFVWHKHDEADEMFYVLKGSFNMELRDKTVTLHAHEFFIVPRGVEHRPVADEEVAVMLFEPAGTINTGNIVSEFTKTALQKI